MRSNSVLKKLVAIALCLAILFAGPLPYGVSVLAKDTQTSDDTEELKDELSDLNSQYEELKKQQDAVQQQINQATNNKAAALAKKRNLNSQISLTQQQIAQMLGIRPQSASEAVANLEEQLLVEKSPNPQDKRSYLLHITPEGVKRQAETQARRQENAHRILAPLTKEEKDTLQALLQKVVAALEENKEER